MKPHDALKQFQEATAFHAEKNVHAFYNVISVDDYEDTRRLVRLFLFLCLSLIMQVV